MTFEITYNVPMVAERLKYIADDEEETHFIIEEIIDVWDAYDIHVTRTD